MRALAATALLLGIGAAQAAPVPACKPPAKAGALLGMSGCIQPDGSLVTAQGFRLRVPPGGGAQITPPSGASGQAGRIEEEFERQADELQQTADQPDAGLERHALREAARFQREFAEAIRSQQKKSTGLESPAPSATQAWCAGLLPAAQRAEQEFRKPKPKASELPPIPPPPTADYWECWGCDRAAQDRHDRESREWVERQWEGSYLALEMETMRAAIQLGKAEIDPAFAQAVAQPGSSCAALAAPSLGLRGGLQAPLLLKALDRIELKMRALDRQYGKPDQYPSLRPVALAYIGSAKTVSLIRAEIADVSALTYFTQQQLAQFYKEWKRRLQVDKDLRQLSNVPTAMAMEKERLLLAAEKTPEGFIEDTIAAAVLELKLDFQVKLEGQNAGDKGYVMAHTKGKSEVYAYTDPDDGRCGLLRTVEMKGARAIDTPMALNVFNAEMVGPGLRNKYLGPAVVNSAVVIELPCCNKKRPQGEATVFIEALGAQQARGQTEQWSQPVYAPYPAVDNWFRLAFNLADLTKMSQSGQGQADAAQMEKDMAVLQQQMDDVQARYDRGEASLADLMAAASRMSDKMLGGASLGQNSLLTQALHYLLPVPFQNNQKQPIKVRLDAKQRLRGGGPEAESLLENLVYGYGEVELTLVNTRKPSKPAPKAQ